MAPAAIIEAARADRKFVHNDGEVVSTKIASPSSFYLASAEVNVTCMSFRLSASSKPPMADCPSRSRKAVTAESLEPSLRAGPAVGSRIAATRSTGSDNARADAESCW